ncbi:hypothetical protein [Bhargavaea ginsengi]
MLHKHTQAALTVTRLPGQLDRPPSRDIERLNAMMELLIAKMVQDESS